MRAQRLSDRIRGLAGDDRGSMAIETAFVAPVLVLLAVAGADTSLMISRQHELQAGVNEAEAIALAANAGASTDTTTLKSILMESLGLSSSQVTVTKQYRCNADAALVSTPQSCSSDAVVSTYVKVKLVESREPIWKRVGVGGTWTFNVERTVQLS